MEESLFYDHDDDYQYAERDLINRQFPYKFKKPQKFESYLLEPFSVLDKNEWTLYNVFWLLIVIIVLYLAWIQYNKK